LFRRRSAREKKHFTKAVIIVIIIKVEKSIELVGVNSKIVRFCKLSMMKWKTRLFFKQNRK
jgi:hypothetical protein